MKPKTNIFGRVICSREACPAFFKTCNGVEGCNAKLDNLGRISAGDDSMKVGMVCKLPIEFEIVRREDGE